MDLLGAFMSYPLNSCNCTCLFVIHLLLSWTNYATNSSAATLDLAANNTRLSQTPPPLTGSGYSIDEVDATEVQDQTADDVVGEGSVHDG